MKNELLFQYRINGQMVKVYKSESMPVENDSYYKGILMAIADYTGCLYEIVVSRIKRLNIRLEHDNLTVSDEIIEETTEGAVFAFLETNSRLANELIAPFVVRPDLSETTKGGDNCGIQR